MSEQRWMDTLPIDIHVDKLLEWLISRRHCIRQWHQKHNEISKETHNILQNDINYIDYKTYFDVIKFNMLSLQTLKSNMLYESKTLDISKITDVHNQMTQQGVGLAGISAELVRLMSHELPSLKKGSNEYQKQLKMFEKQIQSKTQSLQNIKEQFKSKTVKLSFKHTEITENVDYQFSLDSLDGKILQLLQYIRSLTNPVQFYCSFIAKFYQGKMDPKCNLLITIINSTLSQIILNDDTSSETISEFHNVLYRQNVKTELHRILSFFQSYSHIINDPNIDELLKFSTNSQYVLVDVNCDIWLKDIHDTISFAENDDFEYLFLLQSSISCRHRVECEIGHLKTFYVSTLQDITKLKNLYDETLSKFAQQETEFSQLVIQTKVLYDQVKLEISHFYNGRKVNFLSESNKFLN